MLVEHGEETVNFAEYPTQAEGLKEVSQGEWRMGGDQLMTIGVATAVVVVAHNATTGRGLLGQFTSIAPENMTDPRLANERFDTDVFDEALAAISTLGPPAANEIWIGGAAMYPRPGDDEDDLTTRDREYASRMLIQAMLDNDLPVEAIVTSWSSRQEDIVVRLNCRTGILFVNRVTNPL